jgi:hypothetical protein
MDDHGVSEEKQKNMGRNLSHTGVGLSKYRRLNATASESPDVHGKFAGCSSVEYGVFLGYSAMFGLFHIEFMLL